jgi:hypothetical protein
MVYQSSYKRALTKPKPPTSLDLNLNLNLNPLPNYTQLNLPLMQEQKGWGMVYQSSYKRALTKPKPPTELHPAKPTPNAETKGLGYGVPEQLQTRAN